MIAFGVRDWNKIRATDSMCTVGFQLFQIFTIDVAKNVKRDEAEPIEFHVVDMDRAGFGKVRCSCLGNSEMPG